MRADVGAGSLCLAGGLALNSVANSRILRESGFGRFYIQPAAGDSGSVLGAAYHIFHGLLGNKHCFEMKHVSDGEGYSESDVAQALGQAEMTFTNCANDYSLIAETSRLLESGEVIGWFQGRVEWGPRSLGNRSILANPRQAEMQDRVNAKVKFCEPFRPFASSILESRTAEMFDSDPTADQEPGQFMLLVADVSEDS